MKRLVVKMKQKKVLIVEDSQYAADINARQIKRSGFDIEYLIVSGKGTMEKALQKQEWDLILSDNCMPLFSAFGALEVRNHNAVHVPFIIVSEHMLEAEVNRAYTQGMTAFISKCDLIELGFYVKKLFME